jgi:hypothetical protein
MKRKLIIVFSIFSFTLQCAFAQNDYKNGKKEGVWNYYGSNKVLLARHFYNEGVKVGIWEFYDIQGALSWTYNFNTAKATYLIAQTEDGFYAYQGSDGKWVKKTPDVKPIWLSSQSQWNNFLVNKLKFPEEAVTARVPGMVKIKVYIDEQGNVTGYTLGNDIEADLDKEALRVTKLYHPEFVPAQNNGMKVKSIYILKVSYQLADYQ